MNCCYARYARFAAIIIIIIIIIGRTRAEFINHEQHASDLRILGMFFQHPKKYIMPITHTNLWSIAFI